MTNWLVPRRSGRATASRWPIAAMHNELDRLLDDVWRGFDIAPFTASLAEFNPQVDVEETEDAYVVTAELPGLEEKDFDVSLEGDLLTLKGEKKVEREEKKKGFAHRETSSGSFHRVFRLPAEVDGDAVKATHAKGVLTVTLTRSVRHDRQASCDALGALSHRADGLGRAPARDMNAFAQATAARANTTPAGDRSPRVAA